MLACLCLGPVKVFIKMATQPEISDFAVRFLSVSCLHIHPARLIVILPKIILGNILMPMPLTFIFVFEYPNKTAGKGSQENKIRKNSS